MDHTLQGQVELIGVLTRTTGKHSVFHSKTAHVAEQPAGDLFPKHCTPGDLHGLFVVGLQ